MKNIDDMEKTEMDQMLATAVTTAVEPNDNETGYPTNNISSVPTAVLVDDDAMFDDTIDEVTAEMHMPTSSSRKPQEQCFTFQSCQSFTINYYR